MTQTVHIIDVESGNLRSLANAILKVGDYDIVFIHNGEEFLKYEPEIEKLMLPGVGNYGHFVKELTSRGFASHILNYISSGRLIMGICVGLQALFSSSAESPSNPGLSVLDFDLYKFDKNDSVFSSKNVVKSVPEIGWNTIDHFSSNDLYGLDSISKYYFVHSYAALTLPQADKIEDAKKNGWKFAFTKYGSEEFIAAIAKDNVFATQFHPEKSGVAGLKVIKSFLENTQNTISSISTKQVNRTTSGLSRRIIACLDVRSNDNGDLVVTKGDQYDVREKSDSSVRNLGKPVELATKYYNQGADEITFLNITSFRNSPLEDLPMLEVLKQAAKTIFVPLTVGGGIKDMVDPKSGDVIPAVKVASLYFQSGADKVSIGSDAVTIAENYYESNKVKTGKSSIESVSATFGNQAVVISVDPKRKYLNSPDETTMSTIKITDPKKYGPNGEKYCYYQVTSQGGRKVHELGALELCIACEDLGAGEILLNSIDHDGSNAGFNTELIEQVKSNVNIPVIASSGAGNPEHFKQVFELNCGVDAALGAGLFHRGEYEVNDVKKHLLAAGMDVRLEEIQNL